MPQEIHLDPRLQPASAQAAGTGLQASLPLGEESSHAAGHLPPTPQPPSGIAPIWLQRLSLFVLVLFCVYLGVLVMILPWWGRVWDDNLWIQSHPAIAPMLHSGAVRGIISGLGLLDVWIGVSEAVHYRDNRG